jgi:hypothetical protein
VRDIVGDGIEHCIDIATPEFVADLVARIAVPNVQHVPADSLSQVYESAQTGFDRVLYEIA